MTPTDVPDAAVSAVATPVQGPDADAPESPKTGATPRRRSWGRRILWSLTLICLTGAASLYYAIGTQFDLPPWLRQQIEQRIETRLGGLQIEFGAIQLVVHQGWHPRVGLRDVTLRYPNGSPALALADAQVAVSMQALLRGEVQPKSVSLNGLSATLRRANDGVALSFADGADALRQARSLPQLIEDWEQALNAPGLTLLAALDVDGVTLRYEDLRSGRAWTFDGGYVRLERQHQDVALSAGFSVLGGGDSASLVETSYTSQIGDTAADFGIGFTEISARDIATQSPALAWLDVLRVPISGALRGSLDSAGDLGPVSASLELGQGVLQPTDQTTPVPFSGASSYFTYFPKAQVLQFDDVTVDSAWVSGQMSGQAQMEGLAQGTLSSLVGQLQFTDLQLNPLALYDHPQTFSGVRSDFKLELNPFRLKIGETLIQQEDSNVLLRGDVQAGAAGWRYNLDAKVDQVTAQQVKALWPAAAPPKPREWVRDNIKQADGHDVRFSMRGRPGMPPFIALNLGYQNAVVRYQKNLPVLHEASGQLSIYGNRLVATASAGRVQADTGGALDVTGTSFIIPDMTVTDGGHAVVRLQATGPVTAALSLLDRPPLEVMKNSGLPVSLATGQAALNGTLSLPMKENVPLEQIRYHYRADLTNIESDTLVPDHVLRAPKLRLTGDQDQVEIAGAGTLSGVPATARWRLPFGPKATGRHQVSGQIDLSSDAVQALNIGLPRRSVFGQGRGDYVLDLPKGRAPTLTLESNLRGVGLRVPALGWRKGENATGRLQVAATLGATPRVDRIELDAAGLQANGTISLRRDGGLDRAQFGAVRVGNWLRSAVTFTGRGTAPPSLELSGGVLDLRTAPFGSADGGTGGGSTAASGVGPIRYALDRIVVTDSIALHGARGRISTQGGVNGQFQGRLNGQTPVNGVVVGQANGTALRIQSDDAGGVFRSAGLLKNAQGGSFDMTLVPSARAGVFSGQIKAKNTRVKNAPAMLALINSISLVGLVTELTGQGLLFTEVDADFELAPTHIKLIKSSAVGPSIGLSMDGVYDLNSSVLNMRGVLSPIYVVNAIGRVLTRKGEGLIGFTFRLRGTADDPSVQVNPLSGLAPGFLREIFRGSKPLAPGETAPVRNWSKTREERREEQRRRRDER